MAEHGNKKTTNWLKYNYAKASSGTDLGWHESQSLPGLSGCCGVMECPYGVEVPNGNNFKHRKYLPGSLYNTLV